MATQDDPHAELHGLAADDSEHHPPAEVGEGTWQEELAKVNKELTKRINDLRTDNDKFKKATSATVTSLQGTLDELKTATSNNAESIKAQDGLISQASKKADAASTKAGEAAGAADAARQAVQALDGRVGALANAYGAHTHDVEITLQGETTPPKAQEAR